MGFFSKLAEGLTKTRNNIMNSVSNIFTGHDIIDDDFYEELEETLIMADLGISTTTSVIENLKAKVKELKIKDPADCKKHLMDSLKEQMKVKPDAYDRVRRCLWLQRILSGRVR